MKILRRTLRLLFRACGAIILLVVLHFGIAVLLSWTTTNPDFRSCEKDAVEVYILTNGVHTDLVLPIKNELKDWTILLDPGLTRSGNRYMNYVSFGWGDKGFYLETPTWGDLKFSTAFKAIFFLGTTAMHVTFYEIRNESETCKKICISRDNYQKLVSYIENSFELKNGEAQLIEGASYGKNDLFYEALGTYSFLKTCNTWANSALKAAGLKACVWTPFDKGIFYQYSK